MMKHDLRAFIVLGLLIMQLSVVGEAAYGSTGKNLALFGGFMLVNFVFLLTLLIGRAKSLIPPYLKLIVIILPMEIIIVAKQPDMMSLNNYIFRFICYDLLFVSIACARLPIKSSKLTEWIYHILIPTVIILASSIYMSKINSIAASAVGRITGGDDISAVGVAFCLCLAGSISIGFLFVTQKLKYRIYHGFALLSTLPPVIVSGSRGALLSLILVFAFFYFTQVVLAKSLRKKRDYFMLVLPWIGFFSFAFYIIRNPFLLRQIELLIRRVSSLSETGDDVSSRARFNILNNYFSNFDDFWLIGISDYSGLYPHNFFLDFFIRYGLYGVVLSLTVYFLVIKVTVNFQKTLVTPLHSSLFAVVLFSFLNAQTSLTLEFMRFFWFALSFLLINVFWQYKGFYKNVNFR
ncbi:MAG: hypothetical protein ACJAS9_003227 [Polaribacter sp.]|jgi:hypothetical protein